MKLEILKKANELKIKRDGFDRALESFELTYGDKNQYRNSSNPSIIIEHDDYDDEREETRIPTTISDELICVLKEYITKEREKCIAEFDEL